MSDYLTLAEALAIHDDQIERFGGLSGVRAGDERQHRSGFRAIRDEHRNRERGIDARGNFDRAVGSLARRRCSRSDGECNQRS